MFKCLQRGRKWPKEMLKPNASLLLWFFCHPTCCSQRPAVNMSTTSRPPSPPSKHLTVSLTWTFTDLQSFFADPQRRILIKYPNALTMCPVCPSPFFEIWNLTEFRAELSRFGWLSWTTNASYVEFILVACPRISCSHKMLKVEATGSSFTAADANQSAPSARGKQIKSK